MAGSGEATRYCSRVDGLSEGWYVGGRVSFNPRSSDWTKVLSRIGVRGSR